jgi:AhpD family alkylhydroperoxidase
MALGGFRKRTFTRRSLASGLAEIFAHRKEMRAALLTRRIDRAFAEKIMLAVTQVNDCRYCSTFHVGQALKAGVTEEEVHRLLLRNFLQRSQDSGLQAEAQPGCPAVKVS